MNDTDQRVSFVTVYYQTPHLVESLLHQFEEAQLPFPFEYLWIDNDSRDGMAGFVQKRFPWVTAITAPANHGFGAGNNLGLSRARGRYIMLINPDVRVLPEEIEKWLGWMEAHPEVGISGPRVFNPDGTDQYSCHRFYSFMTPIYRRTLLGKTSWGKKALAHFLMEDMDRSQEQDVDWMVGAAMCIRREALERIGFFDERFFLYFEDADLCHRAWEAGFRVTYTPVAYCTHEYQRQSHTRHLWELWTNPLARIHITSGLKFFLKHFGKQNPRIKKGISHPSSCHVS